MMARWISGFSALGILLGTLYFFGDTGLLYLSMGLALFAAYEYSALFQPFSPSSIVYLALTAFIINIHIYFPEVTLPLLMMSFVLICSVAICFSSRSEPKNILSTIQWMTLGLLYTGLLPALALTLLYQFGWHLLLFLLVTVFFGDIFAFSTGLTFGGKKIFPVISPNKTLSGSLGGLLGSVLCGGAFLLQFSTLSLGFGAFICLCIGAFAQFGDFFESTIKRAAGKKDSGSLMPGHGGILDRLDGVYFGSAVLYFFCAIFDLARYFS